MSTSPATGGRVGEVVAEYYGGDPRAAELLGVVIDQSRDRRERDEASNKLLALERERLIKERARNPRLVRTDPDAWEESSAKAEDVSARAEVGRMRFMSGPEFMAATADEPEVLIPRIAYEGCVTMPHGRPRSLKSLATTVGCVEASANLPWWGLYPPPRALRTGLVLEEDSAKLEKQRLTWILAGLGLDRLPDAFRILVRPGLNLESPSERAEFLNHVVAPEKLDLLLIDPTRSPFPGVDGGPEKGAPLRRFAREALDVAGALMVIHHDNKPASAARGPPVRRLDVDDAPVGVEIALGLRPRAQGRGVLRDRRHHVPLHHSHVGSDRLVPVRFVRGFVFHGVSVACLRWLVKHFSFWVTPGPRDSCRMRSPRGWFRSRPGCAGRAYKNNA